MVFVVMIWTLWGHYTSAVRSMWVAARREPPFFSHMINASCWRCTVFRVLCFPRNRRLVFWKVFRTHAVMVEDMGNSSFLLILEATSLWIASFSCVFSSKLWKCFSIWIVNRPDFSLQIVCKRIKPNLFRIILASESLAEFERVSTKNLGFHMISTQPLRSIMVSNSNGVTYIERSAAGFE